ncbi:MAG: ImmA/IrrE family metallo-endopeptidase [Renibacterium sp.]|nr:ImmA/IrrE family metallo-endopeptidase [Renibacterium sp.]
MQWEEVAADLGVTVQEGRLPHGWWGAYSAAEHSIVLAPELGFVQRRSTLAHECGHAFYRHVGAGRKQERQASVWAVRRLIEQSEFIDALRLADDCLELAHQLSVLPSDVAVYVSTLSPLERLLIREIVERNAPLAGLGELAG